MPKPTLSGYFLRFMRRRSRSAGFMSPNICRQCQVRSEDSHRREACTYHDETTRGTSSMSRNPVSLKQRLSALAISPSAPSSPRRNDFGPGTPTPKRSTFFKPPWVRRNSSTQTPEQWEVDKVASVMSRLIYQAGVDYEVCKCSTSHNSADFET